MTMVLDESIKLQEREPLRLNDWAEPAGWMLAFFAGLIGLFLLLVPPFRHGHFDGSLRPVLGLAWLAFALLAASGARSGVILKKDGILVRKRVRGRFYRWADIKKFELQPSPFRPALRICLRDGRQVRAVGFGAKSEQEAQRARMMVAELNQKLEAQQT